MQRPVVSGSGATLHPSELFSVECQSPTEDAHGERGIHLAGRLLTSVVSDLCLPEQRFRPIEEYSTNEKSVCNAVIFQDSGFFLKNRPTHGVGFLEIWNLGKWVTQRALQWVLQG